MLLTIFENKMAVLISHVGASVFLYVCVIVVVYAYALVTTRLGYVLNHARLAYRRLSLQQNWMTSANIK